jgi:hypothetical protein
MGDRDLMGEAGDHQQPGIGVRTAPRRVNRLMRRRRGFMAVSPVSFARSLMGRARAGFVHGRAKKDVPRETARAVGTKTLP